MKILLPQDHDQDSHDRARYRGQDQRQEGVHPAQEGPDHEHHGHVAQAEALLFPDNVVGAVDDEEEPAAHGRAEQGLEEGHVGPEEGEGEAEDDARKGDPVGQDLVAEIDDAQGDEGAGEERCGDEGPSPGKAKVEKDQRGRRHELDEKI